MKTGIIALLLLVCIGIAPHGAARQDGPAAGQVALPDNLRLAATATRRAFFVDLYTCVIYLPPGEQDPARLLTADIPILIRIRVHGQPPDEMPNNWSALLEDELSRRLYRAAMGQYRQLLAGDAVEIHYVPGGDTRILVNDEKVIVDPGRSLVAGLLAQWIGAEPVSEGLKSDITAALAAG